MDVASYKRLLQGFFDPEPKNDRTPGSSIWCLGLQYNANPKSESTLSTAATSPAGNAGIVNGHTSDKADTTYTSTSAVTHDQNWPPAFLDDHESRFWITYRSNFPPIAKSMSASMTLSVRLRNLTEKDGFTSDTGWGCMIRSGQSLLANTLSVLRLGRNWRRKQSLDEEMRLLSCFADDPEAPFSIHKFVEHGAEACGKHPGEWFGPSATARCIEALLGAYDQARLQVYVNAEGADVFQDQVFKVATARNGKFLPTLILLGVRLGIDRVTPAYWEALKDCLEHRQSVGIAGGRPASSHYFIAHQGDDFFYLDPHFTRSALPFRSVPDQYSKEEVEACHTRRLRRLGIGDLDPSMLLGFLIQDENDWRAWRAHIDELEGKSIIHIADSAFSHDQGHERSSALDDVEAFDDEDGMHA